MKKRVVTYARVSGDDRGKEGRNLAGQLAMCREYAQQRGYVVAAELSEDDRGAASASLELPELNRALELARNGEFDILVVREIDRLSRSLAKQLIVEQEFKHCGVQIEYVLGEYPDTPEGNLNKNIKAVIAEYERLKINERMVRGRRLKIKAGSVLVAGHPPYGYEVVQRDGKYYLTINEPEARIVRLIFTLYTTGDEHGVQYPLRAIARKLSELGIPTPENGVILSKNRACWSHQTVKQILGSETYAGVWAYGKTRRGKRNSSDNFLYTEVPAIVDRRVFEIVAKKLKYNREHSSNNIKNDYLMRGRIRCGLSGLILHARTHRYGNKAYRYYVDEAHRQRRCDCRPVGVSRVDDVVWQWVKESILDTQALEDGMADYMVETAQQIAPFQERLAVIDELLTDYQEQLNRLVDLYLEGNYTKDILIDRQKRLENTIEALQNERSSFLEMVENRRLTEDEIESIRRFAAEVREGIDTVEMDFASRRHLIETLNVEAVLAIEDDEQVLYVHCRIGEAVFCLASDATCDSCRCRNLPQALPCPAGSAPARGRRRSRSGCRPGAPGRRAPPPAGAGRWAR